MKIEIAAHEKMSESGSSLLRLIQNHDMPLLDLFVREAVQNSLDASNSDSECVEVDILAGSFSSKNLNRHFEKIDAALNMRYPEKKNNFIAIRDQHTTGLTGPIRYKDIRNNDFGNLLKLVYEISKPQLTEGSGGSWGLGKTIYYRLGMGLVIYYSRIQIRSGKYQSRLAACLVEDENSTDALIKYTGGVKRGIAWWGDLEDGKAVPLVDQPEIAEILNVFGLKEYENDETGTTVIVPYIDHRKLLEEVYPSGPVEDSKNDKPYWTNNLADYLAISMQRWYAPRFLNMHYKGPYLSPKINGKKLKVKDMLSTFKVIRELYILATDGKLDSESFISSNEVECYVENIDLRGVLNKTTAGKLAYTKIGREQLNMDPPNNEKSPYQQIDNIYISSEEGNGPIVLFTRKPGMIVGYDYNGQWTHRMNKSDPDEYVIGLFVLNSDNRLQKIQNEKNGEPLALEEYIRKGEKADHTSWTDRNINGYNPRIVSNIQKHVNKKINDKYGGANPESVNKKHLGLGHALADLLLPSEDFGDGSTPPKPIDPVKPIKPSKRGAKKSSFHVSGAIEYSSGQINVPFEMFMKKETCLMEIKIITDFKQYSANAWEEDVGKEFPIEIDTMEINTMRKSKKDKPSEYHLIVDLDNPEVSDKNYDVKMIFSDKYGTVNAIKFVPKKQSCTLNGYILFNIKDTSIKYSLDFKELKNE